MAIPTSPELLQGILGVLGQINSKMDAAANKKEKSGPGFGAGAVIGTLMKGKRSGEGIAAMADSVKKLNKELDKVNIGKLNNLIKSMSSYTKVELEQSKIKRERTGGIASAAKDMGLALLYTAGGIAGLVATFGNAKKVLGLNTWEVLGFIVLTSAALALSMIIISGADAAGEKLAGGLLSGATSLKGFKGAKADKGRGKGAIQGAKDMGVALMYIAGGILAFAGTIQLVPIILGVGDKKNPLASVGIIAGIVLAMAGIVGILGLAGKLIAPGIKGAKGIGITLGIISLGIIAVALTSKFLMSLGDKDAENKAGKQKGKFGQMMAGVGAGLGLFGLFVVSSVGLFWSLGFPLISGPMMLGAGAVISMSLSLLLLCHTTKKVMKAVDDLGGQKGIRDLTTNIIMLVGGVMNGVINGVMGSGIAGKPGEPGANDLSLKELRQFRRVTKSIKMLGRIATSLSKFAQGLRAFAKLGEISSLEYEEDVNGNLKPVLGGTKIHVVEIAQTIADTFGLFIKNLVENTQSLTRNQARALKVLGKSLTGDRGLISGVSDFASALDTFSKFGSKGEIYVPAVKDDDGKIVTPAEHVKITTVTQNIVDTFGEFVEAMAAKAPLFEIGGGVGRKMIRFTEALMGQSKGFLRREKPGILSAITSFNDVLMTYSEYGKDGSIPVKDKDGNIVPGKSIKIQDVANNMTNGITTFVNSLNTALAGKNLDVASKEIENKLGTFTDIISNFDKLAESQEGMEKLANSMGLLATNVGLLVTNMGGLDVNKLQSLSSATAKHAVTTKGVEIKPTSGTPTASSAAATDWNKVGEIIANKIAEKLAGGRNGEFNFTFYDGNTGGKLEIK